MKYGAYHVWLRVNGLTACRIIQESVPIRDYTIGALTDAAREGNTTW